MKKLTLIVTFAALAASIVQANPRKAMFDLLKKAQNNIASATDFVTGKNFKTYQLPRETQGRYRILPVVYSDVLFPELYLQRATVFNEIKWARTSQGTLKPLYADLIHLIKASDYETFTANPGKYRLVTTATFRPDELEGVKFTCLLPKK